MTEAKVKNNFLNRKSQLAEAESKFLQRKCSGNQLRNMILSCRGDSLSNDELYIHYKEYNRKKFACLFSFLVIPGLTYLYTKQAKLALLSLIPAYVFDKFLHWNISLSASNSPNYATKSHENYLKTVYAFNKLIQATSNNKWHSKPLNEKEFIERNTYK
jgi:hypothetical protein